MAISIFVFFVLLISIEFGGADSQMPSNLTNSSESVHPTTSSESVNPTSSTPTEKCLNTLEEIERELSSKVPPLKSWRTNNYRNISRALFPAVNLPSMYIKIFLQFHNGTGLLHNVKKFTWSESSVFVSVRQTCLSQMTVFSLGTVYPQRRQSELVLTVPRLCEGTFKDNGFDSEDEMWRYTLLTLQDIAIMPNLSDPRVNTAQYVVVGHEGDHKFGPADWYKFKSCWIQGASMFISIPIIWYAWKYLKNDSKPLIKTVSASAVFLFILSIVTFLVEIVVTAVSQCSWKSAPIIHICAFSVCLAIFIINILMKYCCKEEWCIWVIFPCTIYQIVHHLLWVLCAGIPSDPSWAIPIFLCECLAILTLVCAIYMYFSQKGSVGQNELKGLLGLGVFAIWLGIFIVVISFYGRSTAVSTENFLEIIMAAVLLWVIKNSGLTPSNACPCCTNRQAGPEANLDEIRS